MKYTFRIDDISINTPLLKLTQMIVFLRKRTKNPLIILGVSPLVHAVPCPHELSSERVFPAILNAFPNHLPFLKPTKLGIPAVADFGATLASHGLVHVDHRLLSLGAQQLSIVVSCSLLNTSLFIPPFNKYNSDTEEVCHTHGIQLMRADPMEWTHLAYLSFRPGLQNYYFHTHDFTFEDFKEKFNT